MKNLTDFRKTVVDLIDNKVLPNQVNLFLNSMQGRDGFQQNF